MRWSCRGAQMGYFQVYRDLQGYWRWRYISRAGRRIIATSGEGYYSKADALDGIDLVRLSSTAPIQEFAAEPDPPAAAAPAVTGAGRGVR